MTLIYCLVCLSVLFACSLSTLESSSFAVQEAETADRNAAHLVLHLLHLFLRWPSFMQVEHTTLPRGTHRQRTHRHAHTVQHKLAINSQALISRRPMFILSPWTRRNLHSTRRDAARLELQLQQQVCCLSLFLNGRSSLLPKSFVLQKKKIQKKTSFCCFCVFLLLLLLLLIVFVFAFAFFWDAAELSFIDSSGTHINNKLRLSFFQRRRMGRRDNLPHDHNYLSVSCHHLLSFGLAQLSPQLLTQIDSRLVSYTLSPRVSCAPCVVSWVRLLAQQAERLSAVVSQLHLHFPVSLPLLLHLHFDYAPLYLSVCVSSLVWPNFVDAAFFLLFTFYFLSLLMTSRIFLIAGLLACFDFISSCYDIIFLRALVINLLSFERKVFFVSDLE